MLTKKEIKVLLPVAGILGVFTYFANPAHGPIILCIFNKSTGLYCPGCGMTRAVHSILRFNFYQALRFNALIFIMPPFFIFYYYLNNKRFRKLAKAILILLILIAAGYGIMRNTVIFSYLAPTFISKY